MAGLAGIRRILAVHPDWQGVLRLSLSDQSVSHEGRESRGKYIQSDDILTVFWERFAPDSFISVSGVFMHSNIIDRLPYAERTVAIRAGGKPVLVKRMTVTVPGSQYEVELRLGTSDLPTFGQVFGRSEYASPSLPSDARTIMDLGANIGLATVFFALKYPHAKIVSVEPEPANFAQLRRNVEALGERVRTECAAVWTDDGTIDLHTESESGADLGAWGVQVSKRHGSGKAAVCFRLPTLMERSGLDEIDILKIDIEGAELELFSQGAEGWLPRVKMIVVETHDRFRPGSEDSVRQAIAGLFEEMPPSGENLIFRRKDRAV